MVKTPRSPLLGYNHNVKYGGHIFHVQTEDSGPGNPHLFTHLFFGGSILASKRSQYDPAMPEDEVRTMMQAQHKAILKELKQTTYDERIAAFFATRGETSPSDALSVDSSKGRTPAELPATPAIASPAIASPAIAPPAIASPAIATNASPPVAVAHVLDLDVLPAASTEPAHTPEPLPIHVTKPAVPGPGTYTFRRPARDGHSPSEQEPPPAMTKPRLAADTLAAVPTHTITPVIMQRQIIVGGPPAASSRKPTIPVRRRRVSGGPYVVKEGSHTNMVGSVASPKGEQLPLNPTPAANAAQAAHPQKPTPQQSVPSASVTDQSLDDVILAYLSQGEGKH